VFINYRQKERKRNSTNIEKHDCVCVENECALENRITGLRKESNNKQRNEKYANRQ